MPKQSVETPTLRDVALSAGVSRFTVSAVLNGARSNTRVSPATRQRIEDAARLLGYHPNAMARGLMGGRINTLGVFFGPVEPAAVMSNPYTMGILQGIVTEAASLHNNITLFSEPWRDEHSLAHFRDGRTDGVLVVAPLVNSEVLEGLHTLGVAVAAIAATPGSPDIPTADTDNAAGIHLAVHHLLNLGHRRIVHLGGDSAMAATGERRDAFLSAMHGAGLAAPMECVYATRYSGEDVAILLPILLTAHRPTALVCGNDNIAIATIAQAQRQGLQVPRDLSVVGFDDAPSAALVTPRLTTIRQPLVAVGRAATSLLHKIINGAAIEDLHPRLAPELVIRSSTAAPDQRTALVS